MSTLPQPRKYVLIGRRTDAELVFNGLARTAGAVATDVSDDCRQLLLPGVKAPAALPDTTVLHYHTVDFPPAEVLADGAMVIIATGHMGKPGGMSETRAFVTKVRPLGCCVCCIA